MIGSKAGSFEWSEDLMIGFTAGSFDLLHAGHVLMLEEAKGVCDHLIVGLHVDPSLERSNKNKPVQSLIERQSNRFS